ncbi:MAG: LSM domain-containing protein [Sulfolobales archaeon]
MGTTKIDNPFRALKTAINKNVLVKVKDGYEYVGKLVMVDLTMNVVLSGCMEFSDDGKSPIAKYGTVFIRGSQILYIAVDYSGG